MPIPPRDADFYLELWRRQLPDGYAGGLEFEGGGQAFDVVAAHAAIWARFEEALDRTHQAYYLKPHSIQTNPPASGPRRASTVVQIARASGDGELVVAEGTVLEAHALGSSGQDILVALYALESDLVFADGDVGPLAATVVASRAGSEGNRPAGKIDRFAALGRASVPAEVLTTTSVIEVPDPLTTPDQFHLGMVGRFIRLVGLPSGVTYPRRITSMSTAAGGELVAEFADPLPAGDVGATITAEVEELEDLGLTILQDQDATGGRAGMLEALGFERALSRAAYEPDGSYRERLCALEDIISPAAIERIAHRILDPLGVNFLLKETRGPGLPGLIWDVDPWDVGDLPGDGVVWLSLPETVRFFVLCVGVGNQGEFGGAWDVDAWDVMAWDGYPAAYLSAIAALWNQIDTAREAGVGFVIVPDYTL